MTKTYTHSNLTDKSSMMVKGDKELESKIGKAGLIKGQGPDNVKDLEDPDEDKKYSDGSKAKDMTKESSSYEGAFERLFKATINEEEEMDSEEMDSEEIPVSGDDMVDEIEDTEEQESNLISDLQNVMDQLQGILDKLSEEDTEEEDTEEEDTEEKVEEEVESEEDTEEESEEPYEESMDLTQKSHMKVSGKIHTSKGTANKGSFKPSPHPRPHKNKGEFLKSKTAMKVKSSVTPGDFFK